jgi:hypothetical protein
MNIKKLLCLLIAIYILGSGIIAFYRGVQDGSSAFYILALIMFLFSVFCIWGAFKVFKR